ncbi:Retrovirus-related Pol polyprotein from transposon RE1 [Senna tora]|uniref:Retrovirus-related Pol polyprotein from transposon RE1 n=1 Tax=Senna tora TaxID=362788 RepID=A0A834SSZ8_9FABA|nr:Retrovirus-related Pol polyprotein from transposon RE1 [Senna tora]
MVSSTSSASSAASGSSATQSLKSSSLFSSSSQATSINLDRDNYLVWVSVVRPYIKGNRLESHINGLASPPPQLLSEYVEKARLAQANLVAAAGITRSSSSSVTNHECIVPLFLGERSSGSNDPDSGGERSNIAEEEDGATDTSPTNDREPHVDSFTSDVPAHVNLPHHHVIL